MRPSLLFKEDKTTKVKGDEDGEIHDATIAFF
jgi:hypothetical protein